MDIYHIWFNLKPDTDEGRFAEAVTAFLDHMQAEKTIAAWRMMRCKLGLRPDRVPEFHIMVETENLAQLDRAFGLAAARSGETDQLHFTANAMVQDVTFALFRDWPDRGKAAPPA